MYREDGDLKHLLSILQLKDAESEDDIAMLMAEDTTLDLLQRCGITATVKVRSYLFICLRVWYISFQ